MSEQVSAPKMAPVMGVYAVVGAVVLVGLVAAIQSSCTSAAAQKQALVDDCVKRGVKYFMDTGSYPRLSDGRVPHDVATERCRRTTNAF
jgi:hypothetical protein